MNQLMRVVVALVALCYCGGNYCPKVLSSNKEMLLGVAVGMALCSFMDLRMEGFDVTTSQGALEFQGTCCNFVNGTVRDPANSPPECNENPEYQTVKEALCSQSARTREFKGLVGAPANIQFKQTCCGEGVDNINNECFQYAFGKNIEEMTINEFFNDMGEFTNVCS